MTYNIIENDFKRNSTSAYQLSILLGVDSLVYSIYDVATNKFLALKSLGLPNMSGGTLTNTAQPLKDIFQKEDLLNAQYQQVKAAFLQPATSLVPERLFNDQEKSIYMMS